MRHFDLVIIGTGSGNSIPNDAMADWDIAILEKGTFGGTCLNVGCIPPMSVRAATANELTDLERKLGTPGSSPWFVSCGCPNCCRLYPSLPALRRPWHGGCFAWL